MRDGRQGLKFARWETQLEWSHGEGRAAMCGPGAGDTEAGRGRLEEAGRGEPDAGRRGRGCRVLGPGRRLGKGRRGVSEQGGEAGAEQQDAPEVLVAGCHLLQEAGDVESGGAHGDCAAGPPAGENMAARGPLPRRARAALGGQK